MLKFSKKTDYGLIALRHIAAQPSAQVSSAREIAETYGISYELVAKILQALKRHNVVDSVQGVSGGYRLACDPDKLTLYEVVEIFEGRLGVVDCTRSDPDNPCTVMRDCNIVMPMRNLNRKFLSILRETTLRELLDEAGPAPRLQPAAASLAPPPAVSPMTSEEEEADKARRPAVAVT